jgi:predicted TIM-barrel fold metal-dependent hydrolase
MRHKDATVIWAHMGVGRIVHPVKDQLAMMEKGLANPDLKNLHIDLSWTEVAKYVVETPETIRAVADLMNRYPERFLFGTDEVAPTDQKAYLKTYDMYQPLLAALTPDARAKFLRGNYERLFDAARTKVRAWERANVK